ncbi:hypothetical protein, partial [Paracoccus binzhouensis]|uniref:hypothetical protein n=1 Tax=Paracoccus binzhouensis TaxID=2796149 RepID=UPI001E528FE6
ARVEEPSQLGFQKNPSHIRTRARGGTRIKRQICRMIVHSPARAWRNLDFVTANLAETTFARARVDCSTVFGTQ